MVPLVRSSRLLLAAVLALAVPASAGAAEPEPFVHEATLRAPPGRGADARMSFSPDGALLFAGETVIDLANGQWLGQFLPSRLPSDGQVVPVPRTKAPTFLLARDRFSLWEVKGPADRKLWWPPVAEWNGKEPAHSFAAQLPAGADEEEDAEREQLRERGVPPLVAVSSDGTRVVSFEKKKLVLRELKTRKVLARCEAVAGGSTDHRFLAFVGDSNDKVAFGSSSSQFVWDVKSPFLDPLPRGTVEKGTVFAWLALAPAKGVLVGCDGNELVVWNLLDQKAPVVVAYKMDRNDYTQAGAVSADGKYCFVGISSEGNSRGAIKRVALVTGDVETVVSPAENRALNVRALAVSPDGRRLAWAPSERDVVFVHAVGGRKLAMKAESKYFPSAVGTTWVYEDAPTDGRDVVRRRATVLTHEILGPHRCFLVRYEREKDDGRKKEWNTVGLAWYTADETGVYRVGNWAFNPYESSPRIAHLKPILEVPAAPDGKASGEVTPNWINSDRKTGTGEKVKWSAEWAPQKATVFGEARDVIVVERRGKDDKLTVERFAAGVGLVESRDANRKTVLVEFIPAPRR